MGLLGLPSTSILGERMFQVMDSFGKGQVQLDQFLAFMDILYHGTQDEKAEIQFKMINVNKNGQVTYEEFESFFLSLIQMAGNIYGHKIDIKSKKNEIKFLFKTADMKKDGILSLQEFKIFWKKYPEQTDFMNFITKGNSSSNAKMQIQHQFLGIMGEIQGCIQLLENYQNNIATGTTNFSQESKNIESGFTTQFQTLNMQEVFDGPRASKVQPIQKGGDSFLQNSDDEKQSSDNSLNTSQQLSEDSNNIQSLNGTETTINKENTLKELSKKLTNLKSELQNAYNQFQPIRQSKLMQRRKIVLTQNIPKRLTRIKTFKKVDTGGELVTFGDDN